MWCLCRVSYECSVILNEKSKEKTWSLSVCYIKIEFETLQVENIADLQ